MKNFLISLMAILLFVGVFSILLAQGKTWNAEKSGHFKSETITGKIISMNKDTGHVTIQEGNGVEKTFRTDPKKITYFKNGDLIKVVLESVSNISKSIEIVKS